MIAHLFSVGRAGDLPAPSSDSLDGPVCRAPSNRFTIPSGGSPVRPRSNTTSPAFTLIEMIGVLAVIAILAAVLIPKVSEAINNSLINNAAIGAGGETLRTFDAEQAADVWRVNAAGQVLVVQRFLDLLKAGTNPKIINSASEAGSISTMNHFRGYYYFSSKAAMNMCSRSMAWDPDAAGPIRCRRAIHCVPPTLNSTRPMIRARHPRDKRSLCMRPIPRAHE